MPAKGTSRQSDRDCLICGETTRIAHLGFDLCRSCAVFYRRARRGNNFICRSSSGRCPAGKALNCKRCRYDRIVTLLGPSHVLHNQVQANDNPDPAEEPSDVRPTSIRPLLERVKAQYDAMSFTRLSSELNARSDPPHPLEISVENGPFFPADFAALIKAMRTMLTAALEFGRKSFPEFSALSDSDKWKLAKNFFYRFRLFECCYRSTIHFANEPNKFFVSYATYLTDPFDNSFYSTTPPGADVVGAMEFMRNAELFNHLKTGHELIARVNPNEQEFLVITVLIFWTIGDPSGSEEIHTIGERYRSEILKELHAYYRDEMKLDDYASRLGEMMMLMQVFERTKDLKEHFEVLRLFNVITDDNFVYQLQKDLNIA